MWHWRRSWVDVPSEAAAYWAVVFFLVAVAAAPFAVIPTGSTGGTAAIVSGMFVLLATGSLVGGLFSRRR